MISFVLIGKGLEKKWTQPVSSYYNNICMDPMRKTMKTQSCIPTQELYWVPPKL